MVGVFSAFTPASTTKTGRHDIAEILLKVALKHVIIYFVNKYVPRRAHISCRRSWSYVVLFMRILFVFALCLLIGILECKPITNMGWVRAHSRK
jgi:hypothetical protein